MKEKTDVLKFFLALHRVLHLSSFLVLGSTDDIQLTKRSEKKKLFFVLINFESR